MVASGSFAFTVTHWVKTGTTSDAKGNKGPVFTARTIRALAEFPGNVSEQDNSSGDVVTADYVLMFSDWPAIGDYDEFTPSDGRRYKVDGVKPLRNPATGTAVTQVNLRRIT
jgi:hypothetical protein